ncbi:MAG TPA: hypothetical protein VFZ19_03025 [Solirubrobacterales bacterium]
MTVRFSGKRLFLAPGPGDDIFVDDGNRTVPVKPKTDPIVREPDTPPMGVLKVIQGGDIAESLQLDEGEGTPSLETIVGDWTAAHGTPERLDVEVRAASVTDDDLLPLFVVGRRHRIPITVHLRPDD